MAEKSVREWYETLDKVTIIKKDSKDKKEGKTYEAVKVNRPSNC